MFTILYLVYKSFATLYVFMVMQIKRSCNWCDIETSFPSQGKVPGNEVVRHCCVHRSSNYAPKHTARCRTRGLQVRFCIRAVANRTLLTIDEKLGKQTLVFCLCYFFTVLFSQIWELGGYQQNATNTES